MSKTAHAYSVNNRYMFGFDYFGREIRDVVVAKPTEIVEGNAFFNFVYGVKSVGESIPLDHLVAVGDHKHGNVEVVGWHGKYRVLNQVLFDQYVESGAIVLSS